MTPASELKCGQQRGAAAEIVERKGDSLFAQPAHEGRNGAEVRTCGLLGEFKGESSGLMRLFLRYLPAFARIPRRRARPPTIHREFRRMLPQHSCRQFATRSSACSMTQRSMSRVKSWQSAVAPNSFSRPIRLPSAARMRNKDLETRVGRRGTQRQDGCARSSRTRKQAPRGHAQRNSLRRGRRRSFAHPGRRSRPGCGRVPWRSGTRARHRHCLAKLVRGRRVRAKRRCSTTRATACRRGRRLGGWPAPRSSSAIRAAGLNPAAGYEHAEAVAVPPRATSRVFARARRDSKLATPWMTSVADMHSMVFVHHIQLIDIDMEQSINALPAGGVGQFRLGLRPEAQPPSAVP